MKIFTGIDGTEAFKKALLETAWNGLVTQNHLGAMTDSVLAQGMGIMAQIRYSEYSITLGTLVDEIDILDLDIKYYLLEEYNYLKLRNLMFRKALLEIEYERIIKLING
jgi:hypothetical protein